MRTWIRTSLTTALLTTAVLAAAPAAAEAASSGSGTCHRVHQQTGNNVGLLNGLQLYAPLTLGLDVSDNALGILGYGHAQRGAGDTVDCGN